MASSAPPSPSRFAAAARSAPWRTREGGRRRRPLPDRAAVVAGWLQVRLDARDARQILAVLFLGEFLAPGQADQVGRSRGQQGPQEVLFREGGFVDDEGARLEDELPPIGPAPALDDVLYGIYAERAPNLAVSACRLRGQSPLPLHRSGSSAGAGIFHRRVQAESGLKSAGR